MIFTDSFTTMDNVEYDNAMNNRGVINYFYKMHTIFYFTDKPSTKMILHVTNVKYIIFLSSSKNSVLMSRMLHFFH